MNAIASLAPLVVARSSKSTSPSATAVTAAINFVAAMRPTPSTRAGRLADGAADRRLRVLRAPPALAAGALRPHREGCCRTSAVTKRLLLANWQAMSGKPQHKPLFVRAPRSGGLSDVRSQTRRTPRREWCAAPGRSSSFRRSALVIAAVPRESLPIDLSSGVDSLCQVPDTSCSAGTSWEAPGRSFPPPYVRALKPDGTGVGRFSRNDRPRNPTTSQPFTPSIPSAVHSLTPRILCVRGRTLISGWESWSVSRRFRFFRRGRSARQANSHVVISGATATPGVSGRRLSNSDSGQPPARWREETRASSPCPRPYLGRGMFGGT
jgi:hypothetical protein